MQLSHTCSSKHAATFITAPERWWLLPAGGKFSPLSDRERSCPCGVAAEGPTHRWHQRPAQRGPVTAVCKLNMTNRLPASPPSRGDERQGERREGAQEVSCLKWEKMRRAQPWSPRELNVKTSTWLQHHHSFEQAHLWSLDDQRSVFCKDQSYKRYMFTHPAGWIISL